ncbi:MAG: replicative DNA helicase, partial [Planctomycetes bacterium]|nr:replicative DNA helicase [Planctomycetota bacterium]
VGYYSRIVKEKYVLRELIVASTEILNMGYDVSGGLEDALDKAEQKIFALTNRHSSGQISSIKDLVNEAYAIIEKRDGSLVTGLSTGYRDLDSITCGLHAGEMIIVAGRPSMGKTSFALNIAENVALKDKKPVAIFSLEMSKHQLAERLLCSHSRIDSQRVRRGLLDEEHYQQLIESCSVLSEAPIYIDDTAGLTPLGLRAKARRLKSRYDIEAVFVDYLQLMDIGSGRSESRQQEITAISRYLKAMARELDVPVIVLSQLNREAESREGHRPRMSDIRESGSIEQDADVIMLLHREDYYHKNEEDYILDHKADVIIAKQRNGPTGMVEFMFNENLTRFENIASNINEPI